MSIRIFEIYRSLQGESSYAGLPCVFIRTAGCDLRCNWCDTEQAFYGGQDLEVSEILEEVEQHQEELVEVTGGEPLLQKDLVLLLEALLDKKKKVLIETGGHRDISVLPQKVIRIMDLKPPGSGESHKNYWPNIKNLRAHDEIKFVIQDRSDFDWAYAVIQKYDLSKRVHALLFSPIHGSCEPKDLSQWLLESRIPHGRLQLQLHKYIWGAQASGV